MSVKELRLAALFGIIIPIAGCDNVAWGGFQMDIHPPPPPPGALPEGLEAVGLSPMLEALATGPLVYLVQRGSESTASLLPLARFGEDGFAPLPDPAETPFMVERFPLERWEAGTEFVLFAGGTRAGTLISDGSSVLEEGFCLQRPRGGGSVELLPAAAGQRTFLALRKADLTSPASPGTFRSLSESFEMRVGSLDVARVLISRLDAPWPPSVLEMRQDLAPLALNDGGTGIAASFVFGDALEVGASAPQGYSIFYLARSEGDGFSPFFSWYQRADGAGKAVPRFVANHDLRESGAPDFLLEVFGTDSRWWALVGVREGEWGLLYQDPCGVGGGPEAIRSFP